MKTSLKQLARTYETALAKHLTSGARLRAAAARDLGHQAIASGLGTLDLVRIHEQALKNLLPADGPPPARTAKIKRATTFFAEALVPLEQTHPTALTTAAEMEHVARTLDRSTADLTAAHRDLKQEIAERKVAQKALRTSGQKNAKLLAESQRLQTHLQKLTHRILSAQEQEREQASTRLHDEIAQALLGINVWLLALKATATANSKDLQKEIASMEQLVVDSVSTMKQFTHEFGKHQTT
jgi:signal transduction histidine kinase